MKRPARWTLRTRLVVAAVALSGLALVLANVAGLALLRGYLMDRLDDQLRATVGAASAAPVPRQAQQIQIPKLRSSPGEFVLPVDKSLVARIVGDRAIYFFSGDGKVTNAFPSAPADRPDIGSYDQLRKGEPYTVPGTGDSSWRLMAVDLPGGGTVVMASSLAEIEAVQRWLLAIDAGVLAVMLLLLGLAAAALVRLGMRPLTAMEATAGQIAAGDFGRRVPVDDAHTEPGRLGIAMNVMLDRVEREIAARAESEAGMRRFLADASHELRTPLTSVRGFAELYRRGGTPPGPPLDEAMRRIEDEAGRMGVLVDDLLMLARLDEERPMDSRPVDLLEIAADTIRDARARVPDRQVRLAGLGSSLSPVVVVGDEARLRQVAANLVANALAHTPPEAKVTVKVGTGTAAESPDAAVGEPPPGLMGIVEVADTGPGITPGHASHVFERLYRVSESRSRTEGGAGLGLAIVAAIVRAHGGRVELTTSPGEGAAFRVLLPLGSHDFDGAPR
ncbi:two-component sensor histidine kinase [Planotetraspora thailandica]|uniref:histidine kinase n=1 Tax=Planotetraspora thailandica TaxID=487172 RepID=A0A8J3XYF6_9ACTN|nr:ATP-binding protein [Planotetraspora thailandica]GII57156.1 two-component sensor histidine kinase [Planotetraspora thailandica]